MAVSFYGISIEDISVKDHSTRRMVMEKNNVIDKRSVKLENLLRPDYIPLGAGRPEREKVIGKDDILNLRIALNTSESLSAFLSSV
jgi:hypothetical protein